jgi:spermidine synthase
MTRQSWRRWFRETLTPYGAKLIADASDDYGAIQVVELGPYRALYFNSPSCQGRLHMENPWQPASEYLRSILCATAMAPRVDRVLILGLGPGALIHSLRKLYPEVEIHTVELRPIVFQAAKDHFSLPEDDKTFYHVKDATHFVKEAPNELFDLVIVDMAMSDSISPLLVQPGFWVHSLSHLQPIGVICANLWRGSQHRFEWIFNRLGSCLKTPPVVLRHRQIDNMVVFGSPTVLEGVEVLEFRRRVTEHAKLLKFDPSVLIKQLPMIQTNDELFGSNPEEESSSNENDDKWGLNDDES